MQQKRGTCLYLQLPFCLKKSHRYLERVMRTGAADLAGRADLGQSFSDVVFLGEMFL